MPAITLPYDFVGGTRAIADQVDANFAALVNAFTTNVRTVINSPTTFYVAPTGADVAGNGLDPASPAATMTYILSLLRRSYDLNAFPVTIQLANGTYNEAVYNIGNMFGLQGAGALIIQGNNAAPGTVAWNCPSGLNACLECSNGALIQVQGVTMASSTTNCIISHTHSRILFSNVIFGATPVGSHLVSARGATLHAIGNYTISGGAARHVFALEHGEIYLDPEPGTFIGFAPGSPTIAITGSPVFSSAFAVANNLGLIKVGAVFSGSAGAGPQGIVTLNGTLAIFSQGTSYLPGTPNTVSVATGGQYL